MFSQKGVGGRGAEGKDRDRDRGRGMVGEKEEFAIMTKVSVPCKREEGGGCPSGGSRPEGWQLEGSGTAEK